MTMTADGEELAGNVITRPAGVLARWGAEVGVTLACAVGYGWSVARNGWGNPYYAAAVRSMGASWHTFAYASLDPGGWVTVDKPPLAFWVQSLFARVLGFHQWVLLAPAVICGALLVLVTMAMVRRVFGRPAALVSGVVLATTPVVVAMSRSNMPDIYLTWLVTVAAWAVVRAFTSTSWWWLAAAGAACGAGFVTKSLAVALVLPALAIGYLIGGTGPVRRRLVHLLVAVAVLGFVSGGWIAAVDARSVSSRPWIGGSQDGSVEGLVFGYNFNIFGGRGAGVRPSASASSAADAPSQGAPNGAPPGGIGPGPANQRGPAGLAFGGPRGWPRMFNAGIGDQVMWLFPLAAFGSLAVMIAAARHRRWRDTRLASVVMWTAWIATCVVVFSWTRGVLHPYYVVEFAPPLAALSGVAAIELARSGRWRRAVGVVAVAATVGCEVLLIRRSPSFRWLAVAVPAIAVAGLVLESFAGRSVRARGPVRVGARLGMAGALLIAPAVWSLSGIRQSTTGLFPAARPAGAASDPFGGGFGGPPGAGGQGGPAGQRPPGGQGGQGAPVGPAGGQGVPPEPPVDGQGVPPEPPVDSQGVPPEPPAGGFAGASGPGDPGGTFPEQPPAFGGAGSVPGGGPAFGGPGAGGPGGGPGGGTLSEATLRWLEGQRTTEVWIVGVRSATGAEQSIIDGYDVVALGGFNGGDNSASRSRVAGAIAAGKLRFVVAVGAGGFGGGFGGGSFGGGGVFDAVRSVCTAVPATNWGGTGSSGIYDCLGKGSELRG